MLMERHLESKMDVMLGQAIITWKPILSLVVLVVRSRGSPVSLLMSCCKCYDPVSLTTMAYVKGHMKLGKYIVSYIHHLKNAVDLVKACFDRYGDAKVKEERKEKIESENTS
jgi:hypothetical protein